MKRKKKGRVAKKPGVNERDSNAELLDVAKCNLNTKEVSLEVEKPDRMSKTQRKRLNKFIERKLKQEQRAILFRKLAKNSLDEAQLQLLRSSKHLGRRETKREKQHRELNEQKAGLLFSSTSLQHFQEEGHSEEESSDEPSDLDIDSSHFGTEAEVDDASYQVLQTSSNDQNSNTKTIDPKKAPQKRKKRGKEDLKSTSQMPSKELNRQTLCDSLLLDVQNPNYKLQKRENDEENKTLPSNNSSESKVSNSSKGPFSTPTMSETSKAFYVCVKRDPKLQETRMGLPIFGEECIIMDAIQNNPFVIICGETGSGKTTQVPQFLYEAGYGHPNSEMHSGMIGITQPRRIAAMSMSKRVAEELNLTEKQVSYQIRYEGNVTTSTGIKFMTEGVLLKEMTEDFLLKKYSVLLIDEAHERNVNTDILIGLLSRSVPLRNKLVDEEKALSRVGKTRLKPLRVVIMSATLRVEDFLQNNILFPSPPPCIKVDARQHPVTIHFNRKTPFEDHLESAFDKICKIHTRLPSGGILVFVTGQNEIKYLCRKLSDKFPTKTHESAKHTKTRGTQQTHVSGSGQTTFEDIGEYAEECHIEELINDITSSYAELDESENTKSNEDSDDEIDSIVTASKTSSQGTPGTLHVLPLFALLPSSQQMKVFEQPPDGSRLCVIATNIAETSLTIPNIRYVVDTGKVKELRHDSASGIQSFEINWISKASADQRAGRAGRTGPGHCYRLYSSAVFQNHFPTHASPEILRTPIESVVLQLKSMNVDQVANFPFPTSPDHFALKNAENLLVQLGSLDTTSRKITALGSIMAQIPVTPRFSKMLALAERKDCLMHTLTMVACLSVGDPFLRESQSDLVGASEQAHEPSTSEKEDFSHKQHRLKAYRVHQEFAGRHPTSDVIKLLKVVRSYDQTLDKASFCNQYYLRPKAMEEICKLRNQLISILEALKPGWTLAPPSLIVDPTIIQKTYLRQILLSGSVDRIAVQKEDDNFSYRSTKTDEDVYIHPSSCLFHIRPKWVVYRELVRTSKVYMIEVTAIEPSWIPILARTLCSFSKPLNDPAPRYDASKDQMMCHAIPTYLDDQNLSTSGQGWVLPSIEIEFPNQSERFKYFAKALLEGQVFVNFSAFNEIYLSKPCLLVRSWNQSKTSALVSPLLTNNVSTKRALKEKWQLEPLFLRDAFLQWVPIEFHPVVLNCWPLFDEKKDHVFELIEQINDQRDQSKPVSRIPFPSITEERDTFSSCDEDDIP